MSSKPLRVYASRARAIGLVSLLLAAPGVASDRETARPRLVRPAVRETTRDLGHATRDAARAVGHAARDITREVGHAFQNLARKLGD